MALQIFLLLGFQAVYGYVYAELSILIGLFTGGLPWEAGLQCDRKIRVCRVGKSPGND